MRNLININAKSIKMEKPFDLQLTVRYLLSKPSNENIFDNFIQQLEIYYGRRVGGMEELKYRENKKLKGDIFEQFCKQYLLAINKYEKVYLFKEIPQEIKEKLGLKTKMDDGIDIIGIIKGKEEFVAIQCKYRKKLASKVPWKSLSTFIALAERTGPYIQYLVMTNCSGVTRKLPKTDKDKTWAKGSFRKTKREIWLKMVGDYKENKLVEEKVKPLSPEELRKTRLAKFN